MVQVADLAQAVAVSNAYAPEHLILHVAAPRALLPLIESAGSVFLGAWSPESVGDYCSGTNHVLPTYGHARAWSGVSVASFQKQITVQELSPAGLRAIGPCAVTLARAEGLEAHARAVTLRLESHGERGMSVLDLARADIRALAPYSSARMEARGGSVAFNANESPWPPPDDARARRCNRYPDPQPAALVQRLAQIYGVRAEQAAGRTRQRRGHRPAGARVLPGRHGRGCSSARRPSACTPCARASRARR